MVAHKTNLHGLSIIELFELIFSRKLILVVGEWGKGKTLVLTTLAYYWITLMNGTRFLSNIPFNFQLLQPYIEINPLVATKQFDAKNLKTMVTLDEGQRYFDRRDFNKPETKFVMGWAVDLRKDDCQIISTIQYLDWLENRATDFLQMAIVPQFINHYSLNEKEDIEMRLAKNDFWSHWKIVDYKSDREFDLVINMHPFINMYDTRFKPKKLVTDHEEYLRFRQEKWSGKKYDEYLAQCETDTIENIKNWTFHSDKLLNVIDEEKDGTILDDLHNESYGKEEDREDVEESE